MKKILFFAGSLLLVSCTDENVHQQSVRSSRKIQDLALQNVPNIQRSEEQNLVSTSRIKVVGKTLKSAILPPDQCAIYKENDESLIFSENCVPINEFDAAAKQLSGLYKPENFADSDAFNSYQSFMNQEWQKLGNNSLFMVRKWAEAHIHPLIVQTSMIFYPFGGPDVAYVAKFFPDATDYVLVGLEKIGSFRQIQNKLKDPDYLINLRRAFSTYLQKGYFITSEMAGVGDETLSNSAIGGTLCLMLIQLPRLGFEILSVEGISLNEYGELGAIGEDALSGVKIVCKHKESEKKKNFYYFRADMNNRNMRLENLKNFMGKFLFTTMMKSASYVLADKNFSGMRSFILKNSLAILQDDSGIPFAYLNNKRWQKHAFGVYSRPTLKIFDFCEQPDLAEFYQKSKFVPTAFKIGYGFKGGRPNLLLAVSADKNRLIQDVEKLKQVPMEKCKNCTEEAQNFENIPKINQEKNKLNSDVDAMLKSLGYESNFPSSTQY